MIFKNYKAGIMDTKNCHSKFKNNKPDHAVLVIGYGETIYGQGYFIIKNSFGKKWGENGYAKIAASNLENEEGTCGLFSDLWQTEINNEKKASPKYSLD